jgi:broad specificity phosphatase PhoE
MTAPNGTTRVYLVRHGETEWNAAERFQGTADIPMNDAGLAQIAQLAASLRDVAFDAAYTSPLQRARHTAEAILDGRGLFAHAIGELHELSYGEWQGLTIDQWPTAAALAWKTDPWSIAFPNGESLAVAQRRAVAAMTRIVSSHPGQCVLVAGHGHMNRLLLIDALGEDRTAFWGIAQPNGAAYVVDYFTCGNVLRATSAHRFSPDISQVSNFALEPGGADGHG